MAGFDELFSRLAQRRGFREYPTGLLAPRDRNKTLTGLAGAEPVAGAQHAAVQRLQGAVWALDGHRQPEPSTSRRRNHGLTKGGVLIWLSPNDE